MEEHKRKYIRVKQRREEYNRIKECNGSIVELSRKEDSIAE